MITAQTEGLMVSDVKFFEYAKEGYAAIGSCSRCFVPVWADSGARTTRFSKLLFDPTTTNKRIKW